MDEVYALAANMGGIGFIETNKAVIVRDNTLINMHTIEAARVCGVRRFLHTSSACIYPGYRQNSPDVTALREGLTDTYRWIETQVKGACEPSAAYSASV